MKKLPAIFLSINLLLSFSAQAVFVGPGSSHTTITVKASQSLPDDSHVFLEGYLIKQIKHEHYLFKDHSGEIVVEIDDEDFRGITVASDTKIRIAAKVDKDWNSLTLDVDYLELAQ